MVVGDWLLTVLAALVAVPFVVLGTEAFLSLFPVRRVRLAEQRPRSAVLIPAHNEEAGIATTIRNVLEQTAPGDRVLVVADNCADRTAQVAREAGADVAERTDPARRGKGFALAYGLKILAQDAPAVVIVVDADCVLGPAALDALGRQVTATGRPAQGVYLIGTGKEADPKQRLSAFAVLVKNKIRPLGLHRIGVPCLLTGTGMAFPWEAIQKVELGTGNIVEDMKLGADLALAGYPPQLCPLATLAGAAAPTAQATVKQRTRWEHGHVHTLLTQVPRLMVAGLIQMRPKLIGLGLELGVPPLSLLFAGWSLLVVICAIWWQFLGGTWAGLCMLIGVWLFSGTMVFASWMKFGRSVLPFLSLAGTPVYIVWKLPIYLRLVTGREKTWTRTEREGS
jgi:cellulose synthase/poly-beta-1,6-N-acetylglucosamine synthase-like glycosyltransferase